MCEFYNINTWADSTTMVFQFNPQPEKCEFTILTKPKPL